MFFTVLENPQNEHWTADYKISTDFTGKKEISSTINHFSYFFIQTIFPFISLWFNYYELYLKFCLDIVN